MAARGQLVQIPADMVEFFWPQAEPWLARARDRIGSAEPHEFRERLDARKCDLWLFYANDSLRGAGITSVKNGDTITIEALGGAGIDWRELLADLETLAREHGKSHIEIKGRPGWARMFRDDGYRTDYVTLRKAL